MELVDIVAAGVILTLASMLQSVVGFGYALFATPLLVWLGLPLPGVITLVATCSLLQALAGVRNLRATVPWRLSLTATGVRLAGLIIGLLLLKRLVVLEKDQIGAIIGVILCGLVAVQLLWRPQPVKKLHPGWTGLAFTGSGVLGGLCGMGGPPLVLWAMAHDWPTQKIRGFLFATFATSIPIQIVLLTLTFGTTILWYAAIGIALLPLVYAGSAIGLPIGNRFAGPGLRRVAYAVLFATGVSAIVPVLTRDQDSRLSARHGPVTHPFACRRGNDPAPPDQPW